MHLRDDQAANIQKLVSSLYSRTLTTSTLSQLSPLICTITDSHYFALVLLPGENVPEPLYLSNNPEEFNSRYQDVREKDFILHRMIDHARPVHFSELVKEPIPNKQDFLNDLNRVRPVSDCIYFPVILQNRISGFIGVARAGANNNPYNNNEVKIINFVCSFLFEAISKTLKVPQTGERELILDRKGEVIKSDDAAKELLIRLFGDYWNAPLWGESEHSLKFKRAWERFSSPMHIPGDSIMEFSLDGQMYRMEFSKENNTFMQPVLSETPYVKATIKDGAHPFIIHRKNDFGLTSREQEIVDCIYKGLSTKEISNALHISVSTVKKHIWNIYNKVGVDNRTGLIFALSQ